MGDVIQFKRKETVVENKPLTQDFKFSIPVDYEQAVQIAKDLENRGYVSVGDRQIHNGNEYFVTYFKDINGEYLKTNLAFNKATDTMHLTVY